MNAGRFFIPDAAALIALAPLGASGGADDTGPGPQASDGAAGTGTRFVIRELRQADRDLNHADPRINVLFDTAKGRSWVLRYQKLPGSNEQGYVWVEIPRAKRRGK